MPLEIMSMRKKLTVGADGGAIEFYRNESGKWSAYMTLDTEEKQDTLLATMTVMRALLQKALEEVDAELAAPSF